MSFIACVQRGSEKLKAEVAAEPSDWSPSAVRALEVDLRGLVVSTPDCAALCCNEGGHTGNLPHAHSTQRCAVSSSQACST